MLKHSLWEEAAEDDEDEYDDVIIGKEGDYQMEDDGTIVIPKKPPGEEGNGPGGGGGGGEPTDEEGKGDDGTKGGEGEMGEDDGVWDKIDEQAKKVMDRIQQGTDLDDEEIAKKKQEDDARKAEGAKKGNKGDNRGSGSGNTQKKSYENEHPRFKWDQLIKLFIGRPKEITEPSYAKIGRGSITGLDTARQLGAGPPKPGEVTFETKQVDLVFVVDSSGSMMDAIAKIFANIIQLLGKSEFDKSLFTLFKFSTTFTAYKGNFKKDLAVQVDHDTLFKRPTSFNDRMSRVFKEHDMNATNFSTQLADELIECVNKNYNVIIFSDSDCANGENAKELARVLRTKPGKVFMIFERRSDWVTFKNDHAILTPNVTYMEDDEK